MNVPMGKKRRKARSVKESYLQGRCLVSMYQNMLAGEDSAGGGELIEP